MVADTIFKKKDVQHANFSDRHDPEPSLIEGIQLGHDHGLRSKYHLESRSLYQTWLVNFESSVPN